MKTLDEVTKALSICGRHPDCKGCPYENISYPTEIGNTCKDVMHYDALYYMQDRIDKCQEANSPLTWNELKQMEGKPVWIQEGDHGYWIIIDNFSITSYGYHWLNSVEGCLEKEYMGISWQAYRKEKN